MAQRLGGGMWVCFLATELEELIEGTWLTAAPGHPSKARQNGIPENKPDWVQTTLGFLELREVSSFFLPARQSLGGAKSHAMPFLFCTLGRKCSFLPCTQQINVNTYAKNIRTSLVTEW